MPKTMTLSKTISSLRRHVAKNHKTYKVSVIFFLLGLTVTGQTFFQVARLFDIFSPETNNIICLFLLTALIIMSILYAFLKNDFKRHEKYLKQFAPLEFDIDKEEEYDEAWEDADKKI